MVDKRCHRGRHPEDDQLFASSQLESLKKAVSDLSWLFSRGYSLVGALKLVGDRYLLAARQRMAVRRSACSDEALENRRRKAVEPGSCAGMPLGIDGYNLLITIESAVSGGLVLVGRDGCYRDLASIHSTYRRVDETIPALTAIMDYVIRLSVERVDWFLDQPVSNSGRLKALMADLLEKRRENGTSDPAWNIELVHEPDNVLADYDGVVCSADSVVIDRCKTWVNMAADIVDTSVPGSWLIDLRCCA